MQAESAVPSEPQVRTSTLYLSVSGVNPLLGAAGGLWCGKKPKIFLIFKILKNKKFCLNILIKKKFKKKKKMENKKKKKKK